MSIKNPQQDLYETIQRVHEEVGLSGKTKSTSDILKITRAAKGDGGARRKNLSPESQKYLRDNPHNSHHIFDPKGNPRRGTTKEEVDQVDEKLTPQQRNLKRAAQIKTGGRDHGGTPAIQKKAGGDKGSSKARRSVRHRSGEGGHQNRHEPGNRLTEPGVGRRGQYTTSTRSDLGHGKNRVSSIGDIHGKRTKTQKYIDKNPNSVKSESFDDDDNAIIEEIKNRVLAVLGERVAGQEGEGQSGSGERRRANIPTTADSKFLELRKKRQKQTRQAPSE
jgi:hypothetical protein